MKQTPIPFLFMRGGTSRGPYFNRAVLPTERDDLTRVLITAIGAGHPLNIDGIGGGAMVTTKVAMLSPSSDDWADVDYFFAQVGVDRQEVDYGPTCGNILSGVGPAALEMGLVESQGEVTRVRILAVHTGARVEALVQTPGGRVSYTGDTRIDGVPGTGAPIQLNFMDTVGSLTGSLLPTGQTKDVIQGVEITCMDVAMPMMIARAADFGLSGYESRAELDANRLLLDRLEAVRLEAGQRMGLGDVARSVTPKIGLLAPPRVGGAICARYFTPWACHPSMAVTGSQCLAACLLYPGTVAQGIAASIADSPALVKIEHPSGDICVTVEFTAKETGVEIRSAGLLRTARLLARGDLMIPGEVWRT
jgi:4-oxalomesaconate tautomerase